jgi:DNA-binding Lrp family transcriptional regulator
LLDSRLSLQELGAKVHLSVATCWSRIKRFEQEGVIKRYTVDLERSKLGYRDTVIIQLSLASHSEETLRTFSEAMIANRTRVGPAVQSNVAACGGSGASSGTHPRIRACEGRCDPCCTRRMDALG